MKAMVAHLECMNEARGQVAGRGAGKIDLGIMPNGENGKKVYARQCGLPRQDGECLATADGTSAAVTTATGWRASIPPPASSSATCRSVCTRSLGHGGLPDQDAVNVAECAR